jgi:excinuclease ABC subunit C
VYKFLDKEGNILYIGKAINLRNRVKSYFSNELFDRPKVKQMIPLIENVEIVETDNEVESLVLESSLIKEHQPYYNSDKKDDKSYTWIYISTKEEYPTVKVVRKVSNNELKKGELFGPYPSSSATKRIFTYLRKIYPFCTCKKESNKECLYFHLGLCPGPYQGHISKEDYRKNINEIIKFLKGRKRGQLKELEKQMISYSKNKEFEKAAQLRDKIDDLRYLGEKIDMGYEDNEQTYTQRRRELLLRNFLDLKSELGIRKLDRIECYDISNIQGKQAYGSMVVAEYGEIKREEYRIFRINTIEQPDDPGMLKEVLERRFNEKNLPKYKSIPDIILIDGGKSQISTLKVVVPEDVSILGISKGKRLKRKGGKLLDEFWLLVGDDITKLDILNKSILVDLRNEAHRFAILHHRKARAKDTKLSELSRIEGVGDTRRKLLMKEFKGIERIKKATVEDIGKVIKNRKIAIKIVQHFNPSPNPEESKQ